MATVKGALEALPGVVSATVTLNPPEATVLYWPDMVTGKEMVQAVIDAGYGAEITGGDCAE